MTVDDIKNKLKRQRGIPIETKQDTIQLSVPKEIFEQWKNSQEVQTEQLIKFVKEAK